MKTITAMILAALVALASGCALLTPENIDATFDQLEAAYAEWLASQTPPPPSAETNAPPVVVPDPPAPSDPSDEADFASFEWRFGGFNGKAAQLSAPRIAGLKFGRSAMTFTWCECMGSWGIEDRDAGAICAVFFQTAEGRWIGGKFDWISCPDRSSRDYKHLIGPEPYGGWTMAAFPNPCKGAFVVVSKDGKRRSNVIAGEWKR